MNLISNFAPTPRSQQTSDILKTLSMKEINIPKEHDGYIYTITSVEEESVMRCPETCYRIRNGEECYYADDFREKKYRTY